MKIQYPSNIFTPAPRLSLDLPEDWRPMTVSGALLGAIKEPNEPCFFANVIASWTREDAEISIDDVIAEIENQLRSLNQANVLESEPTEEDGKLVRGRVVVFDDEVAGTLTQVHFLILNKSQEASYCDLIHLTGTVGGDRIDKDYQEMLKVIGSINFED